jgi:uncharacterized RDD family membrane protein YckC
MSEEPKNPYAAPLAEISAPAAQQIRPTPATAGLRLGNLLLDQVALFGISYGSGYVAYWIGGNAAVDWLFAIPDLLFSILLGVGYYTLFEGFSGRTPGKWITGTRAVAEDGGKLGFGKAIGRSLCRYIPFEAFSFLNSETRGWHDSIPKSYVVKTR